jgi:hypothetical protein
LELCSAEIMLWDVGIYLVENFCGRLPPQESGGVLSIPPSNP